MLGTTTRSDRGRPARAQRPRRLRQRLQVDRRQRGVDRAVGERQHQHHVDERQRQRRLAEEVGHPQVDVAQPDHDHQRRDRQRQQAEELDQPLAHGARSRTQIIVGTSSTSISTTVKTASSSEITIAWYSASSATRFFHACHGAPARDQVAGGEVGHRVQREQEEQPERARTEHARNTLPPSVVRLIAATSPCAAPAAL